MPWPPATAVKKPKCPCQRATAPGRRRTTSAKDPAPAGESQAPANSGHHREDPHRPRESVRDRELRKRPALRDLLSPGQGRRLRLSAIGSHLAAGLAGPALRHLREKVVSQLEGITCCPMYDNGSLVRSAPDGIAQILQRHAQAVESGGFTPTAHLGNPGTDSVQLSLADGAKPAPAERPAGRQPARREEVPRLQRPHLPYRGLPHVLRCGWSKCE